MVCAIANTGDTLMVTLPLLAARRTPAVPDGSLTPVWRTHRSASASRSAARRRRGRLAISILGRMPRCGGGRLRRFPRSMTKPARVRILLHGARADEAQFAWVPRSPKGSRLEESVRERTD
jgi:hypothetical protein